MYQTKFIEKLNSIFPQEQMSNQNIMLKMKGKWSISTMKE